MDFQGLSKRGHFQPFIYFLDYFHFLINVTYTDCICKKKHNIMKQMVLLSTSLRLNLSLSKLHATLWLPTVIDNCHVNRDAYLPQMSVWKCYIPGVNINYYGCSIQKTWYTWKTHRTNTGKTLLTNNLGYHNSLISLSTVFVNMYFCKVINLIYRFM